MKFTPNISLYLLLVFFMTTVFSVVPLQEVAAQSVLEKLGKRFARKSKIKKLGKRLRGGGDVNLKEFEIEKEFEVLGYEPSWLLNSDSDFKDYYFNLFTGLVVGEYDINPTTGYPRNTSSFNNHITTTVKYKKKRTNILQLARLQIPRMKMFLNLTYQNDYGAREYRSKFYKNILQNEEIHSAIADSLKSHFANWNEKYNIPNEEMGIVIDLKELSNFDVEDLSFMVNSLREYLGDEFLIYLKIEPVVGEEAYLTKGIIEDLVENEIIDLYILKGYGFEKYMDKPGPTALVYGSENQPSIDSTLNYYINNGLPKDKMIVEFAYKGIAWERLNEETPYKLRQSDTYVTIDEILTQMPRAIKDKKSIPGYSHAKDTTYAVYKPTLLDGQPETIYYYDSDKSYDTKYEYVRDSMGLKGIGLYGLGYNSKKKDGENNWYAIARVFSKRKSTWGWLVASYLVAFIPIGFVFSIARYWQVRNVLAKPKFKKYLNRFWIAFFVVTLICVIIMDFVPFLRRDTIGLLVGAIIVGIFVGYIAIRRYLNRIRKYTRYVK